MLRVKWLTSACEVPQTCVGIHERNRRLRVESVLDGISIMITAAQESSPPSQPLSMATRQR